MKPRVIVKYKRIWTLRLGMVRSVPIQRDGFANLHSDVSHAFDDMRAQKIARLFRAKGVIVQNGYFPEVEL
jgi:hypothetical protein